MELNRGDIIEFGQCSKITNLLPFGTIFKVLDCNDGFIKIKDSLIMKLFNNNDRNKISYSILTLTDESKIPDLKQREGYCLMTLDGFKLEIIKIPDHKNGIE